MLKSLTFIHSLKPFHFQSLFVLHCDSRLDVHTHSPQMCTWPCVDAAPPAGAGTLLQSHRTREYTGY